MENKAALCILTRGRSERQITLNSLHPKLRKEVILVVDEEEEKDHKKYKYFCKEVIAMPRKWLTHKWGGNFSDKKDWIARHLYGKKIKYLFFLDDDLRFDSRADGKLRKAKKLEVLRMFGCLYLYMKNEDFVHVALSPREGNNRVEEDYRDVGRAMRVCGFNLERVFKHNLEFNRLQLMADFDITLQLLEHGYPNRILYKYANGQRKSNDEGGCSLYRTPETMRQAANQLYKLHPNVVKVQEKTTAKPWAGFKTNKRTDVTVYWRKAYELGKARSKKGITTFFK